MSEREETSNHALAKQWAEELLGGTHSGFNNPTGGAPNWDDQPLDIGLIFGTDLFHVSLVISS